MNKFKYIVDEPFSTLQTPNLEIIVCLFKSKSHDFWHIIKIEKGQIQFWNKTQQLWLSDQNLAAKFYDERYAKVSALAISDTQHIPFIDTIQRKSLVNIPNDIFYKGI